MITNCPNGHRVEVPAAQLGLETRCPTCSQTFVVNDVGPDGTTTHTGDRERAPGTAVHARAAWDRWADRLNLDVLETLRPAAQLLLLLGLLLALISRGWDSVGDRNATAANARVQAAVADWNDEWEDRLDRISEEEKTLRETENLSADDRQRLADLRVKRQNILDERAADRAKEIDKWNDLERSARETQSENQVMKPWREAVFVFGTILFALGLLVVGYTTEGPVRWFCLVLLSIILIGLYLGNVDLLSSGSVKGTTS